MPLLSCRLRPARSPVFARGYLCQKPEDRLTITAQPRPFVPMERARKEFWGSGRLPVQIHGDKLGPLFLSVPYEEYMRMARQPHIQRKLLELQLEDESGTKTGERVHVLTDEVLQKMPFTAQNFGAYDYVTMRRWPRNSPLKLRVPFLIRNEDQCPQLKAGNYTHDMFASGLACLVSDVNHIPMYLEADMGRAINGDLRVSAIDFPPGVTPAPPVHHFLNQGANLPGKNYPDFLVMRAKKIK